MSKPTFDEKYIAAALDLAAKATPRPWHAESLASGVRHLERNCSDWYFDDVPDGFHLPGRNGGDGGSVDGNYIALAANDFPAALEEILALRTERDYLREKITVLEGEAKAAAEKSGLANVVDQYEALLAAERGWADRAEAEVARLSADYLEECRETERLRAALAAAQRAVRPWENGAHHCRWCPAGSANGWQHEAYCAYVEHQRNCDAFAALASPATKAMDDRSKRLCEQILADPDIDIEAGLPIDAPRFFHDHGVVHDRLTGRHICTAEHPDTSLDEIVTLLNELASPTPNTEKP